MMTVFLRTLILSLLLTPVPARSREGLWRADYASARESARETGRPLLLLFDGSDWCHWCHRLNDDLFAEPEFREFADASLVPVRIDFPRRRRLPALRERRNHRLAQRYGVRAYPTVLLVDPESEDIMLRHAYVDIPVEDYLDSVLRPYVVDRRRTAE